MSEELIEDLISQLEIADQEFLKNIYANKHAKVFQQMQERLTGVEVSKKLAQKLVKRFNQTKQMFEHLKLRRLAQKAEIIKRDQQIKAYLTRSKY